MSSKNRGEVGRRAGHSLVHQVAEHDDVGAAHVERGRVLLDATHLRRRHRMAAHLDREHDLVEAPARPRIVERRRGFRRAERDDR